MKGIGHGGKALRRPRFSIPPKEEVTRSLDGELMSRILRLLKPSAGLVAIAVFLLILFSVTSLVGPYITRIGIDDYIATGDGEGLMRICLIWFGFLAVAGGLNYVQIIITNTIGQRAMKRLRAQIYAHMQKLPISFYDRSSSGRLMTRVTNDVEVLSQLFTEGIVSIFGDVFALIAIVVILVTMNLELALVAFAAVPLLTLTAVWFKRFARRAFREVRAAIANINVYLQESLTGICAVKSFGREDLGQEEFDELNSFHLQAIYKAIRTFAIYFPLVDLIQSVAIAAILWYGGGQAIEDELTFGALVAFIQYSGRFFKPIRDLADKFNILQDSMTASERIFSLLDEPIEEDGNENTQFDSKGTISYREVVASYDGTTTVLNNISFDINPGTTTAIVGATGAGKTSLVNLLMRFYNPVSGTISIGGTDISDIPRQKLRQAMAIVEQEVFLFSGSIKDNIDLGDETISKQQLETAVSTSRAKDLLARLPDGLNTTLSERGMSLSSGERQLLAFARALAFNPDILILDEATASVDSQTESLIQDALKSLLQKRTAIVIAHRLSTIRSADQILVLNRGEIKERGTHDELIAKKGLYERLYRFQFEHQEDAPHP